MASTSSKAAAPHPSGWLGQTARRVDARQHDPDGPPHSRWRGLEKVALRQVAKGVSSAVAEKVLSSAGGDGEEVLVCMDWPRMARVMGAWQRERLAVRPARFEPQEATRIVEGRPVQAP